MSGADVQERFRALARHPDVPRLLAGPPAGSILRTVLVALLALAGLAVVGFFGAILFLSFCPPLGLLPVAAVAIGGYAFVDHLRRGRTTARRAALVIEERSRLEGDTEEGGVRTRRTATLAFEDGTRAEVEVLEGVEVLHPDDLGVAELSDERLTRFTRVPL